MNLPLFSLRPIRTGQAVRPQPMRCARCHQHKAWKRVPLKGAGSARHMRSFTPEPICADCVHDLMSKPFPPGAIVVENWQISGLRKTRTIWSGRK